VFEGLFTAYAKGVENTTVRSECISRLSEEIFGLLVAGTHTTALSITETLFQLSKNPDCLAKLRIELDTATAGNNGKVDIDRIRQLPYLVS